MGGPRGLSLIGLVGVVEFNESIDEYTKDEYDHNLRGIHILRASLPREVNSKAKTDLPLDRPRIHCPVGVPDLATH